MAEREAISSQYLNSIIPSPNALVCANGWNSVHQLLMHSLMIMLHYIRWHFSFILLSRLEVWNKFHFWLDANSKEEKKYRQTFLLGIYWTRNLRESMSMSMARWRHCINKVQRYILFSGSTAELGSFIVSVCCSHSEMHFESYKCHGTKCLPLNFWRISKHLNSLLWNISIKKF